MRSGPVVVVTPPAANDPVITLAEAKLHLRVTHSAEDTLINALVGAATRAAETETGRQLVTATLRMSLDAFPRGRVIELPRPPLITVASVTYLDDAGATQTLHDALYTVDIDSTPGRLVLADTEVWPSTANEPNAVKVTYTAGYGAAAAVPATVKAWMLLQVGALYRNREAFAQGLTVTDLPGGFVDRLLDGARVLAP